MKLMEIAPQLATMIGAMFVVAVVLTFLGSWLDGHIKRK